jgi:hypothetical protein
MIEATPADTLMLLAGEHWVPRCLHVVAELGIADALGDTPQTATSLADATGTNADALGRVIRLLSAYGVFEMRDHLIGQTSASQLLQSNPHGGTGPKFPPHGGPNHPSPTTRPRVGGPTAWLRIATRRGAGIGTLVDPATRRALDHRRSAEQSRPRPDRPDTPLGQGQLGRLDDRRRSDTGTGVPRDQQSRSRVE